MPPNTKLIDEIRSFSLLLEDQPFEKLFASVRWEAVGKGRQGAVLVRVDENGSIPIVRTTTNYNTPAQRFRPVHEQLAQQIQSMAALSLQFNNALIENYTNAYTTMGSHSDQSLDLAAGSSIAVFSCYEHPDSAQPPRKLIVESKEADGEKIEIPLTQNSVVVFSVAVNRRFLHKIVLDPGARTTENRWLGITFRTSKTYLQFRDDGGYFPDGTRLTLADDAQRREFYQLRRQENTEIDFSYPQVTYTISASDLMPPEFEATST